VKIYYLLAWLLCAFDVLIVALILLLFFLKTGEVLRFLGELE